MKKIMKNVITFTVIITSMVSLWGSAFAIEPSEITTGITAVAAGAVPAYEAKVIMETAGRAGCGTVDGRKGLAFEVLLKDVKNIKSMFKSGVSTKLSESSTDELADLVTTNTKENTVEYIQCKDGTSNAQARKVVNEMKSGKYDGATVIGTTESAEKINEAAAKAGISQTVEDSGISTKRTERIAKRAFGEMPETTTLIKSTGKVAGAGAVIAGVIALGESVSKHSDLYDTIGHVSTASANAAVSMGLMPIVVEGTSALLVTAGVTGAAAAAAPAVIGILVPTAAGYYLSVATETVGTEKVISNLAEKVGVVVSEGHEQISSTLDETGITEFVSEQKDAAVSTYASVKEKASKGIDNVKDGGKTVISSAGNMFTGVFHKIVKK